MRGGKRSNSGRKQKYGEETNAISFRCPKSKIKELKELVKRQLQEWEIC